MTFEPCPNCKLSQPITAEYCGACRWSLIETASYVERMKRWMLKHPIISFTMLGVLFYGLMLPAPYSPWYWAKRTFLNETALCEDGVYSFSSNRAGSCSSHGGVRQWLH